MFENLNLKDGLDWVEEMAWPICCSILVPVFYMLILSTGASGQESNVKFESTPTAIKFDSTPTVCVQKDGSKCPEWVHKMIGQYPPLPDAPSETLKKNEYGQKWNKYANSYELTWGQTFGAKRFWLPHAIWATSIIYDAEVTHQGLAHHRCVEGNGSNRFPSRGELYKWDVPEILFVSSLDLLLRKVGFRWWTYDIGPIVGSEMHFQGGTEWFTRGCFN